MRPFFHQPPPETQPLGPGPLAAAAAEAFDQGFALPIAQRGEAAGLIFRDVEEHVDGNGACALWLLRGAGRLHCHQGSLELRPGDVVVFDDRLEHAFDSRGPEPCLAISLALGPHWPPRLDPEALRERLAPLPASLLAPLAPPAPAALSKRPCL